MNEVQQRRVKDFMSILHKPVFFNTQANVEDFQHIDLDQLKVFTGSLFLGCNNV